MNKFSKNIDKLISKILNEEIDNKVNKIVEEFKEGEWTEIEVDETLHGKQKNLDVAKPKGKLTAADFKKLRQKKNKKQEVDELTLLSFDDDEEDDFDDDDDMVDLSRQWQVPSVYDRIIKRNTPKPTEDINDYDDIGGNPYIKDVDESEEMDEAETEEGNAFTGALSQAKKQGKDSFEVDGKRYNVKEEKKWIQKTEMKKGALHKKLGVPDGDKIPVSKLKSLKAELSKKSEGKKKLSDADAKLLKQVNLALTLKGLKENKNSFQLTEDELIDMIERIVIEQKVSDKSEKQNIKMKKPLGLQKTEKTLSQSKKENEDYAKSVVKKIKDYVKSGSEGEFKENTDEFPKSNYQMKKDQKVMKYNPSDAVEEYIEAFAYPGQTNLVFDEIKPDDKKIEKYLKGDSTTGNATKDKSGKALGNVVPSEVGERFMKNYKDNLYGAEQMKGSYKRQPQPVDVGGSEKLDGSLKSIRKGSSTKANKIMSQLESNNKKENIIKEEMSKMKNLISYNRKTQ